MSVINHRFRCGDIVRISSVNEEQYDQIARAMLDQGYNAQEYGCDPYTFDYVSEHYNFFGIDADGDIMHYERRLSYGSRYVELAVKELFEGETPASDQWDESVRGQKMSTSTGKVIFKYQMPVLEEFTMNLPKGAEIIRMRDQGGMFWLWAVVDTNQPDEERLFHAVKCGANVPDKPNLQYVGFCAIFVQQELGLYIFEDCDYDQNS